MLFTYMCNPQCAPGTRRFSRNSSNVIPFLGRYYLLKLLLSVVRHECPPPPNTPFPLQSLTRRLYTRPTAIVSTFVITSQTNVPPPCPSYNHTHALCAGIE
uniref:Uncharacterized protein n=1 Tax=Schizaphis graminum TaxID=13262 RepID=A0A2S2P3I4_SCHGA